MVAELLAIDAFCTKAVHLPRLAQLAAGAPITRSSSFVVHRDDDAIVVRGRSSRNLEGRSD